MQNGEKKSLLIFLISTNVHRSQLFYLEFGLLLFTVKSKQHRTNQGGRNPIWGIYKPTRLAVHSTEKILTAITFFQGP